MRPGEWTLGMALAQACAVQALSLRDEASENDVLKRFRGLRPDPEEASRDLGEQAHEDTWLLVFKPADKFELFDTEVKVSLLCERCNRPLAHNWDGWTIRISQKDDTRPGEATWTYKGGIGEPMRQTDFDHWSE